MNESEDRLRRKAEQHGNLLEKAPTEDPRSADYGLYRLLDTSGRDLEYHRQTMPFTLTRREVEQFLDSLGEADDDEW